MELELECVPCILKTRARELEALLEDPRARIGALSRILREAAELLEECATPPELSTQLFRRVRKIAGVDDPYRRIKEESNRAALELYRELKREIELVDEGERLEIAVRASLAGNSVDVGVSDYEFPLGELEREMERARPEIDHTEILEEVGGELVVFLLDNCGEAVLDRLLAEELEKRGARTTAIVKGGSFQNDITIKESDMAGLNESFSRVISTGTDGASVFLDEISEECKSAIFEADLIVSKGMAHFEYLDEIRDRIRKKIVFMLRAKCTPVAEALKVPLKSYVVKLI